MIRAFGPKHRQAILRYAYKFEQENMFVIGHFAREKDPFEHAVFAGAYRGEQLIGIGAFFRRFGSLVLHAASNGAVSDMADHFVKAGCRIEFVPCFEKCGRPAVSRLRRYGYTPKQLRDETVFLLTRKKFKDHPEPGVVRGTPKDVDDVVRLERLCGDDAETGPVTDRERAQIFPDGEYLLRRNGVLVARANIQGTSEKYVQLGGVMTHPEHRGHGYAKQVVSALCRDHFKAGRLPLLFCKNDNAAAIAVYEALGFRPIDRFLLAAY